MGLNLARYVDDVERANKASSRLRVKRINKMQGHIFRTLMCGKKELHQPVSWTRLAK